jgi:hypothetical protein
MDDKWLELLKQGKCITERDVKILCEKVISILKIKFFRNKFLLFLIISYKQIQLIILK